MISAAHTLWQTPQRHSNAFSPCQAMVLARVDCLPADALLALKLASAIGLTFTVGMLAAVHPMAQQQEAQPQHPEAPPSTTAPATPPTAPQVTTPPLAAQTSPTAPTPESAAPSASPAFASPSAASADGLSPSPSANSAHYNADAEAEHTRLLSLLSRLDEVIVWPRTTLGVAVNLLRRCSAPREGRTPPPRTLRAHPPRPLHHPCASHGAPSAPARGAISIVGSNPCLQVS